MNDRHFEPTTPDQKRAQDALAALPAAPADRAFRDTLRHDFARGTLAPRRVVARPAGGRMEWDAARLARWAGIPLAAAALFVAVSVLNRGPDWSLVSASGIGIAVVDARPVPMNHTEDLARMIRPGSRLRVPAGSELEIMSPGRLLIQVTGGTDVTIPARPGRWYSRDVSATVESGEIRIMTGKGFRGGRLAVTTPHARVRVTGSTLAVICEPIGTCVCVLEGRVEMGMRDGPMDPIASRYRRFIFEDGHDEVAAMRENEAVSLGAMLLRRGAELDRR